MLGMCSSAKITKIAIGMAHESIPYSESFCFGAEGSVFAKSEAKTTDVSNTFWNICDKCGLKMSCGNGGDGNQTQAQINISRVIEGTYHFKNGQWKKI